MDNHWDNLPEHLQDHIKAYIPMTFMSSELQTDIKVQSSLCKVNRLANLWKDVVDRDHEDEIEFQEQHLFCYLDSENISTNLMECGCCIRHSGFKRTKTLGRRFINKISLCCETDCKCACRHWIRQYVSHTYKPIYR